MILEATRGGVHDAMRAGAFLVATGGEGDAEGFRRTGDLNERIAELELEP